MPRKPFAIRSLGLSCAEGELLPPCRADRETKGRPPPTGGPTPFCDPSMVPNDTIEVLYPLCHRTEEVTVGNAGYRWHRYQVTWRGDTVLRLIPQGRMPMTVYSDFDNNVVPSGVAISMSRPQMT